MSERDQQPVTSLPFEVRLSRADFDLVTITILAATTGRDRMKAILAAIYAGRPASGNLTPSDAQLSALFSDAWTIVYRLDLLRRVLSAHLAKAPDGSGAAEFRALLWPVKRVRDRMEHVDAAFVAKKTKAKDFPILGIITAVIPDPSELAAGVVSHLDHLVLSHSEFHAKLDLQTALEQPFPIQPPVDHIRLHAFESVINLSLMVALAEGLTDVLDKRQQSPPGPESRLSVVVRQTFDEPLRGPRLP